jgi:2-dehydro-3-deoxyphosphogluconate aldolase/(4S)-4-hydroxy-2-oxoglutarate aldolase
VLAIDDSLEDAVPLARALADNGLPVLEITLRTAMRTGCDRR